MAQPATTAPSLDVSDRVDLATAVKQFAVSGTTLRDNIRVGRLPAIRFRGKLYVRPEDVATMLAPRPVEVGEDRLRIWAQRAAAKAPAFRPDQRDVIVSAFTAALRSKEA